MNKQKLIHRLLTILISAIWLINGLFCKVLNLVPRHRQIIARILGENHAMLFTSLIGLAETCMSIWILSRIKPQLNAVIQIIIIAVMNTLEFFLVPDLLLWGKLNALFALLLIVVIFYNEFAIQKKIAYPL